MSQLGFGVMIHRLFGSSGGIESSTGKRIESVFIDEDAHVDGAIVFRFDDGTGLHIYDDGRSCCESRYLHTDDDLTYFSGATLLGADVESADDSTDEYGDVHEALFLHIRTDKGTFTVETHNEHNGYYGGFAVVCKTISPDENH